MPASSWKQEVSLRLAAHQSRRAQFAVKQASPAASRSADSRAAQAAARVAARFAHAPSYNQMQEAAPGMEPIVEKSASLKSAPKQSRTPAQKPSRAAGPALRHGAERAIARAVAAGPQLTEPQVARAVAIPPPAPAAAVMPWLWEPGTLWAASPVRSSAQDAEPVLAPAQSVPPSSLDAWEKELSGRRREADLTLRPVAGAASGARRRAEEFTPLAVAASVEPEPAAMELGEGATGELEDIEPDLPIQANLIEFPRELVAPRKMRPRLVEAGRGSGGAQLELSIFEVDPGALADPQEAIATAWPEPEWSGIELEDLEMEALDEEESRQAADARPVLPLASIERRLMAALVDGALICAAFLGAAVTATACISHPPAARIAEFGVAVGLLVVGLLYQALFLMLSEATPGMRYARISLCTFDGMQPTRKQLRGRLGVLPLSVLPVGLGIAWILFDEDRLSWHDRLSKTYPRQY